MTHERNSREGPVIEPEEHDVLRYRDAISSVLKRGPLSQTALFVALARRDRRPNPETRGHPTLMPSAATRALKSLQKERAVLSKKEGRALVFRLADSKHPSVSIASRRTSKKERPLKEFRSEDSAGLSLERRVAALEKTCGELRAWKEDLERRRAECLRSFERSLVQAGVSSPAVPGMPS